LKIGIAFDLAPADPALRAEGPDDRFEEFDKPETVEAIAEVIRGEGHVVSLLGDGRDVLARVLADPPDFVFNIAEGEGVGRCREARVPAVLEMLGIPYSGSDPLTLSICLDKAATKRMLHPLELPPEFGGRLYEIPRGFELPPDDVSAGEAWLDAMYQESWLVEEGPPLPLIFKPAFEGSSKGIRGACIARSKEEAVAIYRRLIADYGQPILAEVFIEGDEVTVGVLGTPLLYGRGDQEPLGVMRVVARGASASFVYSLEVKRDWRNRVDYEAPTSYPIKLVRRLEHAATCIAEELGCRDLARIDFRVRDGVPYFIEANPLPGLAPVTSDLVILAQGHGIGYADLVRRVLHAALTRVGLK
jgi:D-alanine-D-alanine ligase